MILVTGATGLVGLHLIEYLSKQKKQVKALYRNHIPDMLLGTVKQSVEWVQGDVLDLESLENCFADVSQVYHCAAIVTYDPRHQETMMGTNVEGTANIVNFCLDYKVQKLVFVSSIAAIGKEGDEELISEKNNWNPTAKNISQYGISKHKAEMEVWRGAAEGLNAAVINPAVILGEGDMNRSSTNLFKIVHDEFPYYTQGITGWVDVKDVVKAMVILMDSDICEERFILCAGNYAFKDIFTSMAHSMNKKPPHKFATKWMTEIVWRLSYVKSLLTGKVATITKETAHTANEIHRYNNQKFLTYFPEFKYMDIHSTIERISKNMFSH